MNPALPTKKTLSPRTILYTRSVDVQAVTVEDAIERAKSTGQPVVLYDYTGSIKARILPTGEVIV